LNLKNIFFEENRLQKSDFSALINYGLENKLLNDGFQKDHEAFLTAIHRSKQIDLFDKKKNGSCFVQNLIYRSNKLMMNFRF